MKIELNETEINIFLKDMLRPPLKDLRATIAPGVVTVAFAITKGIIKYSDNFGFSIAGHGHNMIIRVITPLKNSLINKISWIINPFIKQHLQKVPGIDSISFFTKPGQTAAFSLEKVLSKQITDKFELKDIFTGDKKITIELVPK